MANCNFRIGPFMKGPPGTPPGSAVIMANGKSYGPIATGATLDVPAADGAQLAAQGYSILGLAGTTAQRPAPTDPDWPVLGVGLTARAIGGVLRYFDTTISAWIFFDEVSNAWRHLTTLALA